MATEKKQPGDGKVSVLMPVYNRERYVGEAIESILAQTYENWELLIQDDGSTDSSLEIVRGFESRDERVRVLEPFAVNRGIGAASNALLGVFSGEFVTWQDSDDLSDPQRLERQLRFLRENEEVGAVGTGLYYVDEKGKPYREEIFSEEFDFETRHICCASVMTRREVAKSVGLFRYDYGLFADMDWLLRLGDLYQIRNIPQCLYGYRRHSGNITKKECNIGLRFDFLAVLAAKSRRRGEVDCLDEYIRDGVFCPPEYYFFLHHPEFTLDKKFTLLRNADKKPRFGDPYFILGSGIYWFQSLRKKRGIEDEPLPKWMSVTVRGIFSFSIGLYSWVNRQIVFKRFPMFKRSSK